MKRIFFYLAIPIISLNLFFCKTGSKENISSGKTSTAPFSSSLDSLQGNWHSAKEVGIKIVITGHDLEESIGTSAHFSYSIYFSDTPVTELYLANTQVDVNATSGQYILWVNKADNTIECFKYGGVSDYDSVTRFGIKQMQNSLKEIIYVKE